VAGTAHHTCAAGRSAGHEAGHEVVAEPRAEARAVLPSSAKDGQCLRRIDVAAAVAVEAALRVIDPGVAATVDREVGSVLGPHRGRKPDLCPVATDISKKATTRAEVTSHGVRTSLRPVLEAGPGAHLRALTKRRGRVSSLQTRLLPVTGINNSRPRFRHRCLFRYLHLQFRLSPGSV
jgi:hypothetical protein